MPVVLATLHSRMIENKSSLISKRNWLVTDDFLVTEVAVTPAH